MGEVQWHHPGKLAGLLTLPRENWEAIESDLLDKGFTLADVPRRVSWRAVANMVKHTRRGSALHRVVNGENAEWGLAEQFLAGIHDGVWLANWQRTVDGSKNRNRPKPVVRPWLKAAELMRVGRFGSKAIPVGDWDAWWDDDGKGAA